MLILAQTVLKTCHQFIKSLVAGIHCLLALVAEKTAGVVFHDAHAI